MANSDIWMGCRAKMFETHAIGMASITIYLSANSRNIHRIDVVWGISSNYILYTLQEKSFSENRSHWRFVNLRQIQVNFSHFWLKNISCPTETDAYEMTRLKNKII